MHAGIEHGRKKNFGKIRRAPMKKPVHQSLLTQFVTLTKDSHISQVARLRDQKNNGSVERCAIPELQNPRDPKLIALARARSRHVFPGTHPGHCPEHCPLPGHLDWLGFGLRIRVSKWKSGWNEIGIRGWIEFLGQTFGHWQGGHIILGPHKGPCHPEW